MHSFKYSEIYFVNVWGRKHWICTMYNYRETGFVFQKQEFLLLLNCTLRLIQNIHLGVCLIESCGNQSQTAVLVPPDLLQAFACFFPKATSSVLWAVHVYPEPSVWHSIILQAMMTLKSVKVQSVYVHTFSCGVSVYQSIIFLCRWTFTQMF